MVNRIPKANPSFAQKLIPKQPTISSDEKVLFSFEALEKTEYFNLDATCPSWSSDLFDMLKDVSHVLKKDLTNGVYRTYRVHNHEGASFPGQLPSDVALKDCYQIRISKSKGGIHGVFFENVFYVMWLDPLHNMYPDDRYGGLRIIEPPKTCCKDRDEKIAELSDRIAQLEKDNKYWEELVDSITMPC